VKDLLIRVFAGPLMIAALAALGMGLGYVVGFIAACVIVPIVAIVACIWLGKRTTDMIGLMAFVLGLIAGLLAADGCHKVRQLETGAFVRGVALDDLPRARDKDRLTLRDAVLRRDLARHAIDVYERPRVNGVGKEKSSTECQAYPIVAPGWTEDDPVRVWRFGDHDWRSEPDASALVFRPAEPSALCKRAIARAVRKAHLTTAPDAIYLEALVQDHPDVRSNELQGVSAVVGLGALWIVVALVQSAREWLGDWWSRRTRRRA